MKTFPGLLLLIFGICITAPDVIACSCTNAPTAVESFESVDAVFYGVPESVEERGYMIFAIFRVEKSIKGVDRDRVWVETGITSCDMQFKEGVRQYLFVAGRGDMFRTLPCHRHHGDRIFEEKPALDLQSIALASTPNWKSPSPSTDETVHATNGSFSEGSKLNQNWVLLGLGLLAGVALVFATLGVFLVVNLFRKK